MVRQPHEVRVTHCRVQGGSGRHGLRRHQGDAGVFDGVKKAEGGHVDEEEVVVAAAAR